MRTPAILAAVGLTAVMFGAAPGTARADRRSTSVAIPVVGEHGVAVYCTRNLTPTAAAPMDGGGYRITGLAPGRYVVRLDLPHERIDVLTTVPADGEVIVPPIVARGRCRSIEVVARTPAGAADSDRDQAVWSLRYGRSYDARQGLRAADVSWRPRRLSK